MGFWTLMRSLVGPPPPEDPLRPLEDLYSQHLTLLQDARRSLADVATARARLEESVTSLRRQSGRLQGEAEDATARNEQRLALSALSRRDDVRSQISSLLAHAAALKDQEEESSRSVTTLARRTEDINTQRQTLRAQHAAAAAHLDIQGALATLTAAHPPLSLLPAQDDASQKRSGATGLAGSPPRQEDEFSSDLPEDNKDSQGPAS